jgi:hypothetical protein
MTDFSVTFTVGINCFGIAPSNKWGAHNWNAFLWGEGTKDLETRVQKLISESVAPDTTITKDHRHPITETLSVSGDLGAESLSDGSGYLYVFPDRTTDGEQRDFPVYTSGTAQSTSFACQAAGSTVWS